MILTSSEGASRSPSGSESHEVRVSPAGAPALNGAEERRLCLSEWVGRHVAANFEGAVPLGWLLGSHWAGQTVLPTHLGLSHFDHDELVASVLRSGCLGGRQRARLELLSALGDNAHATREKHELRALLAEERVSEVADVEQLLLATVLHPTPQHRRVARVIALGCLGSSHLWSDLGLRDRPQLRELIGAFFPEMVRRNSQNMRWKRFLYRELCERGGDYVCRAPSCGWCPSYDQCFVVGETV